MKVLYPLALLALFQSFVLTLSANVIFQFEDADGSSVISASNSGQTSGTWSSESPLLIDNGSLNIGYTQNNKSTHVNNNNTIDSFTLDTAIDSGKQTFQVVIGAHDLSSTWNNPSGFVSFGKDVKFSISDSSGNSSVVGLSAVWNLAFQDVNLSMFSDDSNGNQAIDRVDLNFSTDTSIVNGVSPITFEIEVDLDNGGTWNARAKWGSGDWTSMTQNGVGLQNISTINIETSYSNNSFSWGNNTNDGVVGDFVEVASLSLTEVIEETVADISISGSNWGGQNDSNLFGTEVSKLIGDSDQKSTAGITLQIAADLTSGDWVSRYKSGSGDWIALVTDGQGIFDFNRFQLNVKTDSSEAWGNSSIISPSTGDYIKISSVRVLSGSNFAKSSASFDADYAAPFLAIEFEDAAGTNIEPPNDNSATIDIDESDVTTVAISGSITGNFNYAGHLTDGNGNLNIGYTADNKWVNNFENSYRTFTFDDALTSADTNIAVFEVIIPEYDLSKSWDENSTSGSFDGKGLQVSVQNSLNAGASINILTDNKIIPNSVLQLDFDDVAGTSLPESSVYSALNYSGTWEFGGPQTDGDGNLNIGYAGLNRWTGIYGSGDSGTVYRTFVIDSDPSQPNNQAIESGRYIFETRIDAADLSGAWKSSDHLVTGKGMQIILRKSDNSGAVLNFFSHLGNNGYQIKAQSNTWTGGGTTGGSGLLQAFGLSSEGKIDLQIRLNLDTGQWTTHAKSTSSTTWKNMELAGTGLTDLASIQLGVKTPTNDNGTTEDTTDDTLFVWGDDTLNGNASEDYVDANEDGMYNAGVAIQSSSTSELFVDSGDDSYPYAYTMAEPVVIELPQDASMSADRSLDGNGVQFTWSGTGVTVESSEDLVAWNPVTNPSSQILESLGLVSAKFYRLTMTGSGNSSATEQNLVIDVSSLPEGGANYRIITSDSNGDNLVQSDPAALGLGENTITVPSSSAERNVTLWIDGDVAFTSINKNNEAIFTAIPGETFTDANGNGVRDPGNAPLVGDYIKINYIRITEDSSPDSNNSIALSSNRTGGDSSVVGANEVINVLESSSSQTGSIQMKIEADLNTGAWSSFYSLDSGVTWDNLVTDGTGLQSINNITFGVLNPDYGAWGDSAIIGGSAGDYIKVNSINLTDATTQESLVALNFDDATGTVLASSENTGSVQGAWNYGGPRVQNGYLNIGYTEHWKWTGITSSPYRKYILNSAITAKQVSLVVDIADYNLSRSWDNAYQYDINSLSNKGILFRLDANDTDGATVQLATENAANALLLAQDADGDGEPDFADSHPDDPFNGVVPTGIYVNSQFNDADGTQIRDTLDNGSYAPNTDGADAGTLVDSWTGASNDVRVINGSLGWGYPGSYFDADAGTNVSVNWSDANTASKFRTKVLISDITEGIAVYETVISGYDLSRSWDSGNTSQFQKGWRMIIKNGATSTDRQGAAINLYVTSDNDVMVEGQSWYTNDAVVLSSGNVRSKLNDSDQADAAGLTLQIVVDTDTGYWYSRYKKNDASTWTTLTVGSGFTKIDNIQITHRTPSGDAWGDANTTVGDYVLIDEITIKDSSENPVPTPSAPQSLTDSDGDGVYDFADFAPDDANSQYDMDGDGVGNGDDANDEDASVN